MTGSREKDGGMVSGSRHTPAHELIVDSEKELGSLMNSNSFAEHVSELEAEIMMRDVRLQKSEVR